MQSGNSEERIVITELQKLLSQAANLATKLELSGGAVDMWTRRARHNLKLIYGRESSEVGIMPDFDKVKERDNLPQNLAFRAKIIEKYVADLRGLVKRNGDTQRPKRIFIGHGRSLLWRELKDFIVDDLKLLHDELDRISVAGRPITDRLNEMLSDAMFAFLVLTAEDQQIDGSQRARQNVVHEAGLFQGRLGFGRAILLVEENVDEFSNSSGLVQIRFPRGRIQAIFYQVQRSLLQGGIATQPYQS
jgi:predicted nucleotide-binding protein